MDLRQFIFFDQSDHVLFVRTDAETAEWQVDELSLTCLFPYDPERLITRGMRIGFEDDDGNLQPFEVRKVRNYEPDETQELTCEHIVISELTDIHTTEAELTNASPSSALSTVLGNQPLTMTKKWVVGNVSATATSSGDIGLGSIWQNIRTVEQNWNVYILPRVTFNTNGITGRYLDIVPAQGVWHGLRLSLDKNADEAGITIDDTEVKTALFGYGGTAYEINNEHTDPLDKSSTKITLVGYNWPGHPAGAEINSLQGYIVDTAATNNYGRNGLPRFGFYQNSDITDQATLAQKTWEALQTTNKPRVTVDCMVRDLYRMGYHDEKIRLHDTALVELLPMNDVLQLEIIKLSVNLLDPTATRPTIGAYIPNIVYIQRETAREASGGVSGKLSGRVGSSQTNTEAEWSEFTAGIDANNLLISLHAEQVDRDNNILKQAGVAVESGGVLIYAGNNLNDMKAEIQVNADSITQIVTAVGEDGEVTAASIALAINDSSSNAIINADHIYLNANQQITLAGMVTVNGTTFQIEDGVNGDGTLTVNTAECYNLEAEGEISTNGLILNSGATFQVEGSPVAWQTTTIGNKTTPQTIKYLCDSDATNATTITYADFPHYHKIVATEGTGANAGKITITLTDEVSTSDTTNHITNFNIAATQFYIDGVAAAKLEGWNAACDMVTRVSNTIYGPQKNSYGNYEQKYRANYSSSSYSASSHSHSDAWMKVDGHTYWSDKTVSLSNYTGNAQFNSGYDSYSPSSYSPSSFSWTTY